MKGYIYHITNKTNGKCYIGQTVHYEIRKATHLRDLRNNCHHSKKLQNAWNKYGEENFYFSVKEYEVNSFQDLFQLEIDEIAKYDSYFNGYNMTIGGEGSARKNFSFEDYCFIRAGNLIFEAMCNKTSKYFKVDTTVITDIIHDKTYLDYKEKYEKLSNEEINNYIKSFISIFNIDTNNPPKILNKKKVKDEILRDCLCIMNFYEKVGKSLEEKFSYSKGTMSALKRGIRYPEAWKLFNQLTEEEQKQIAIQKYNEWEIEKIKINRLQNQGGCSKAYSLTKEDYYYAFYLQEHNFSYSQVAEILEVKPNTVKDWFNGRSRKKEKQEYLTLSQEQMEVLKLRYKAGTLNN